MKNMKKSASVAVAACVLMVPLTFTAVSASATPQNHSVWCNTNVTGCFPSTNLHVVFNDDNPEANLWTVYLYRRDNVMRSDGFESELHTYREPVASMTVSQKSADFDGLVSTDAYSVVVVNNLNEMSFARYGTPTSEPEKSLGLPMTYGVGYARHHSEGVGRIQYYDSTNPGVDIVMKGEEISPEGVVKEIEIPVGKDYGSTLETAAVVDFPTKTGHIYNLKPMDASGVYFVEPSNFLGHFTSLSDGQYDFTLEPESLFNGGTGQNLGFYLLGSFGYDTSVPESLTIYEKNIGESGLGTLFYTHDFEESGNGIYTKGNLGKVYTTVIDGPSGKYNFYTTTPNPVKPFDPELNVDNVSMTTAEVEWNWVSSPGAKITATSQSDPTDVVSVDVENTASTLSDLNPDTTYNVEINDGSVRAASRFTTFAIANTVVSPEKPVIVDNPGASNDSVTAPANTDQIHYSLSYDQKTGVWTLVSNAQPGYTFASGAKTLTSTGVLSISGDVTPRKVTTPESAVVTDKAGWLDDTVTTPKTEGITYDLSYDRKTGKWTMTATANKGYVFSNGGTTLTESGKLDVTPIVVTPAKPTITDKPGYKDDAVVAPVNNARITYKLVYPQKTGKWTLTATAAEGYVFADGKATNIQTGQLVVSGNPTPPAPPAPPAPQEPTGPQIPDEIVTGEVAEVATGLVDGDFNGFDAGVLGGVLAALAGGLGLGFLIRRRRNG